MTAIDDLSVLLHDLANAAGDIAREHFRTPFDIVSKDDASPVTIADRAIEQRLREMLEDQRPDDGIIGEEFGNKESKSGLTWVLDPIDGTKSFVIGRPTFGTLIGLWEGDNKPLAGVIDQPISRERWISFEVSKTKFSGARVKTRKCASLSRACTASTTPAMFKEGDWLKIQGLESKTKMMAWGSDCYAYGLLASGFMDIVIEASLSTYDYAALVPVVQGAGGIITDWQGQPLTLSSEGKVLACGDQAVHAQMIEYLNG